jgi:nicotinate-nucleotide adenylyltransferase
VHNGHLFITEVIRVELGYDLIVFSPASRSPHKREARYTDAEHRLRMLSLAVDGRDDFLVSDWECRRGGLSYTIETVRHLYNEMDIDGKLGFIMGDDLVAGFESWRDVDDLVDLVDLLVVNREDEGGRRFDRPHRSVHNARLPISASSIRDRAANDGAFRYLVPEAVYHYIRTHALYSSAG